MSVPLSFSVVAAIYVYNMAIFLTTHINTHLYLDSWVTILHLYPGKWTFVVKALPKTTW